MATLNADYRKVALFSADAARSSYLTKMQVSNPESPLILYPRTTVIDAKVKSVSPIGPNTVLVRFDTIREDPRAQPQPAGSWVAVIRYRYSSQPMRIEDRFVNPLGFQVTSYRKDPEALPVVAADAVTPSALAQSPPGPSPSQGAYYPPAREPAPSTGSVR